MYRMVWLRRPLALRRLVLWAETPPGVAGAFRSQARRLGLPVVEETVEPAPGDLWVACLPAGGWGGVGWDEVGWVRAGEVVLALNALSRLAPVEQFAGVG